MKNLLLYFSKKKILVLIYYVYILYNQYSIMVYYLFDQYHLS